jgi:molecular chaperone DnaJ
VLIFAVAIEKNLYDILGVVPSATTEQIRSSYRNLARQVHPDVGSAAHNATVTMAEINYAWSVLADPVRRREYDNSQRVSRNVSSSSPESGIDDRGRQVIPPTMLQPVRFPWRGMLIAVVVGSVIVLIARGFTDPPPPGIPDQLLEPGSCVVIGPDRLATEVSCGGPHEYVVAQFIPLDRVCPMNTETFRDRQGMGIACVTAVVTGSSVVTSSLPR